jgi:hypothetical protein
MKMLHFWTRLMLLYENFNVSCIAFQILPDDYVLQEGPINDKADNPLFPPLEKGDSFNRWMSKELEEVDSQIMPNSDTLWNTVEAEGVLGNTGGSSHDHLDTYAVGPVISEDQLFSIIDYSPCWAYVGTTTKVQKFCKMFCASLFRKGKFPKTNFVCTGFAYGNIFEEH